MITKKNTVVKLDSWDIDGNCALSVKAEKQIKSVSFIVENCLGKSLTFSYPANSNVFFGEFKIENPVLWNISNPFLYKYTLCLFFDDGTETIDGTFGIRNIESKGKKNVFVNGKPVFLRGYIRGTTAHEHSNNCNLTEEDFYRKNIMQAKKFGFNFVRFHSKIPNETFFKVADELGILVHIELREIYDEYNNLEEMIKSKPVIVSNEFIEQLIDRVYNHPSLALYCIGNEIKGLGASERAKEIGALIKKLDGSRMFLDTCAWGENNRDGVDIDIQHLSYYFPFGKHSNMYEDTDNLLVCGASGGNSLKEEGLNSSVSRTLSFNVPLISHEVCHYTALRDFKALKEKFDKYGTPAPWWVDEELKMIDFKGLTSVYDKMYKASKTFQLECWKTAFEAMRKSRLIGGFQFLQFADTDVYENSNGLVDCFDDQSYITAEQVSKFNGDETLLCELGKRIFFAGETVSVPITLSNCGEKEDTFADFSYELQSFDGETVAKGSIKNIDVSTHGISDICKITIELPKNVTSGYLLKVKLENSSGIFAYNDWKIWAFEKTERYLYKDFISIDDGICVTDDIEKALQKLSQGKKVCLIYRSDWTRHLLNKSMEKPKYAFKATWNRFKPVIWDRGTNYGGLCNKELLNKFGFATEEIYDFNYSTLTEDCDKIILDDFPVQVNSLISGIDKCVRDRFDAYAFSFNLPELQYDRTLRNFSYMFELCVGKGKLLVCGLNLTGIDENEPSSYAMAEFIKNYMRSNDFAPQTTLTINELEEYLIKSAEKPVKERMMTQFWQLDDTPVESMQYWEDSRAYVTEE